MAEINLKVNLSYGEDKFLHDNDTTDPGIAEGFFMQFIFWGIVLPIIGIFGFLGNALTIIVLWRREMRSTTILYLRILVITDSIIIVGALIVLTPYSIADYAQHLYFKDAVYPLLFTPFNFIIMATQSCNVWLTVSVTIERYIAICHPFKAQKICTRKKAVIVICSICVISLLYNIPRLLAYEANPCQLPTVSGNSNNSTNSTQEVPLVYGNSTDSTDLTQEVPACYILGDTEFGKSDTFKKIYIGYMYLIIIYIIPLSGLFGLNILIIRELMQMRKRRGGIGGEEDNEANLSVILVLIVIVFLICQTPGLISQFDIFGFAAFLKWISVSNTLFVLNSSVNFLIYTAVGKKFRRLLVVILRRCVCAHNSPTGMNSMKSMRQDTDTTDSGSNKALSKDVNGQSDSGISMLSHNHNGGVGYKVEIPPKTLNDFPDEKCDQEQSMALLGQEMHKDSNTPEIVLNGGVKLSVVGTNSSDIEL